MCPATWPERTVADSCAHAAAHAAAVADALCDFDPAAVAAVSDHVHAFPTVWARRFAMLASKLGALLATVLTRRARDCKEGTNSRWRGAKSPIPVLWTGGDDFDRNVAIWFGDASWRTNEIDEP